MPNETHCKMITGTNEKIRTIILETNEKLRKKRMGPNEKIVTLYWC